MKITDYELSIFFKQIAMTYKAGININSGIGLICEEMENLAFKKDLLVIKQKLDLNMSFYNAIKESVFLEKYCCEMIGIGEKTGYLDQVLQNLSEYYLHLADLKSKMKETITYPIILFISMIFIMLIIVLKVLPIFKVVLNNLGTDIGYSAYLIMNIATYMAKYGLYFLILLLIIISIYFFNIVFRVKNNRIGFIFNNNFITKKLSKKYAISKYLYGLDLLLKSGYYDSETLYNLCDIVSNKEIKQKGIEIADQIKDNKSLAIVIIKSSLLTNTYNKMLNLAYKTGKLDEMISFISREYDKNVDYEINSFINHIEPVLIIICVVIVVIILLSIIMPLLSVMVSL